MVWNLNVIREIVTLYVIRSTMPVLNLHDSHQMFLIIFLLKTIFLLSNANQCWIFSQFPISIIYLCVCVCMCPFFLRCQVPYSLIGTGPVFLMFPQANLVETHSHSMCTVLQKYYISHPLNSCHITSQKKSNPSIHPENFLLSGRLP